MKTSSIIKIIVVLAAITTIFLKVSNLLDLSQISFSTTISFAFLFSVQALIGFELASQKSVDFSGVMILGLVWTIIQVVAWVGTPWGSSLMMNQAPIGVFLSFTTPLWGLILPLILRWWYISIVLLIGYISAQFHFLNGTNSFYTSYALIQTASLIVGAVVIGLRAKPNFRPQWSWNLG